MRVINGNLFFSIYNGNAFKIINPHCNSVRPDSPTSGSSHSTWGSALKTQTTDWTAQFMLVSWQGLQQSWGRVCSMLGKSMICGQFLLWQHHPHLQHPHPTPTHTTTITTENIFREMIIITWIRKKIISYKAMIENQFPTSHQVFVEIFNVNGSWNVEPQLFPPQYLQ